MPKNIVLLSDGTGNSSAKLAKTNVWRTYQALELGSGEQIAWYDDGVGTSSVKPLAILGGAFGWGLKRNVLSLYKFLCRNYEEGDSVYGFGFSRGAFTIRVLVGLVAHEGLVPTRSEEELAVLVKDAYRSYRSDRFRRKASLSRIGRLLRQGLVRLRNGVLGLDPYDSNKNRKIKEFTFLGLWDTVDAYGVPIKELKDGIDRYIWPMKFKDMEPSPLIKSACHALALDDERETFHPLVWQHPNDHRMNDTIQQVWFTGMHSNVGGGYPDDALAHVPLMWILRHAAAAGLRLQPAQVAAYEHIASPFGRLNDSRSGLGSYYRYSPRSVDSPDYPRPARIHESVFHRMAAGDDYYAPISIGPNIRVVLADTPPPAARAHAALIGADVAGVAAALGGAGAADHSVSFGTFLKTQVDRSTGGPAASLIAPAANLAAPIAGLAAPRRATFRVLQKTTSLTLPDANAYALVVDTVFWRRVSYWLLLTLTFALVALRWASVPLPGDTHAVDFVSWIMGMLQPAFPAMAAPWLEGFSSNPVAFCVLFVALVASYVWGDFLEGRIHDRARIAWNVRGRADRSDFMVQSGRRWRFGTQTLVFVAVLWLAWAAWRQQGVQAAAVVLGGAVLLYLARRLFDRWRAKHPPKDRLGENPGWGLRVAQFLTTNKIVRGIHYFVVERSVPLAFAIVVVLCAFGVINRVSFAALTETGRVCSDHSPTEPIGAEPGATFTFDISEPCFGTHLSLDAGAKYRIEVSQDGPWADGDVDGISTAGYSSFDHEAPFYMVLGMPLRREVSANWLAPVAHLGQYGGDDTVLAHHSTLIEPKRTGELFMFVNDAVLGVPGIWRYFYANNQGKITVKIWLVEPPASF